MRELLLATEGVTMSKSSWLERNTHRRRHTMVGTTLLAITLLPSCGGSGSGGGSPVQPSTPVRTVLFQDNWALEALQFIPLEGEVNAAGTLDVTVEWTFATNDVDVGVTTAACSDELFAQGQCDFLATAMSTTAKPERLSVDVTAGRYTIWVVNFGPEAESGTIEVGLTR